MIAGTLEMAKEAAAAKYAAYKDSVHENLEAREVKAHEGLKRAYRELSRGHELIDLETAFRAGGLDEVGRPKLAIARGPWAAVHVSIPWQFNGVMMTGPAGFNGSVPQGRDFTLKRARIPARWIWPDGTSVKRSGFQARSPVPIVPINLLPRHGLQWYWILFEANWEAFPDPDPMLLKHCFGSLFVVVAKWDMTPLETAVLKESSAL